MRKVLKWVGILVAVLLLIIVVAALALYLRGNSRLNEEHDVTVAALTISTGDEAALARGEHLAFAISLCAECHGDDLGGKEFLDSPVFGTGDAPNLTTGAGGIGADYTDEDWVRAIRYGVKRDGKSVWFMPSQGYDTMSDADLAAVIAYAQSVPPVDRKTEDLSLGPAGTIIIGNFVDTPAAAADYDPEQVAPAEGVTEDYGAYLTALASCADCHGEDLDGDVPMGAPAGPDLTALGDWSEQDFINTMRQGVNPDGDKLDPEEMPWDYYTRMTDDELRAIWLYMQTK